MNLRRRLLLATSLWGATATIGHAQVRRDDVAGRFKKIEGFDFDKLPFQDAITLVHGNGKRRIAVFSDPRCGHCQRLDKDLKAIGNVTVHVFLYPVLGEESVAKARNILCSARPARNWEQWIEKGIDPGAPAGRCDASALQRNAALGKRYDVSGTPTLIFGDGTRVPGAIRPAWIEQLLDAADRRQSTS